MSRHATLLVLGIAASIVSGCNRDSAVVATPDIPTAGVRFVHAVPDTGALDLRFVDIPENNTAYGVAFRSNIATTTGVPASTQVEYKNTRAGQARHFRIFLNSTDQTIAQTVIKDTAVNITAGHLYTVLLWGYANPTGANRPAGAPAMQLSFVDETVADPGANVALRVINATTRAIDASYYPNGGAAPPTPTWTNVPSMTLSAYVTTAPGAFRFNIRNAGAATNLIATDALALQGQAAVTGPPGPFDAVPGTTIAGSAVTALIFPRSVAGTAAPQTAAFANPAISFIWDRRPPRPPGV